MGKVIVHLKLTNYSDLILRRLKLAKGKVRVVEVEALVDTGVTRLYLKPSVIKKLGLARTDTATRPRDTLAPTGGEGRVRGRRRLHPRRKQCRSAMRKARGSDAIRYKYEPVELELMDRRETFDVIEVPENVPNLLGQVPLEVLDFVVDSKGQRLILNPAHGGEQMTEEYSMTIPIPRPSLALPPLLLDRGEGRSEESNFALRHSPLGFRHSIDAPWVTKLNADLEAYKGVEPDQSGELEFAEDGLWPAGKQENVAIRREFGLPADKAFKG